jgi:arylformamidase
MQDISNPWIDVSVPLHSGMVHWPNDPPVMLERSLDLAQGDAMTLSRLNMGVHSGTHVDAPAHFIRQGKTIDELPLAAVAGPARVIEIMNVESITPADLTSCGIQAGERILFKTSNSSDPWYDKLFREDFVYLTQEAAEYLVRQQVQTVGIDYLSIGGYKGDGGATHIALLGAGIWIIEGLYLANISAGDYEMVCLPLRLLGAEGAPARVILRQVNR